MNRLHFNIDPNYADLLRDYCESAKDQLGKLEVGLLNAGRQADYLVLRSPRAQG